MATLNIEATPSSDLTHYRLWLDHAPDGDYVPMDDSNKGSGDVAGVCGDGSRHRLRYVIEGAHEATLGLKMICDGGGDIPMPTVEIYQFSPAGGSIRFVL